MSETSTSERFDHDFLGFQLSFISTSLIQTVIRDGELESVQIVVRFCIRSSDNLLVDEKTKRKAHCRELSKEQASAKTAHELANTKVVDWVLFDEDLQDATTVELVVLEDESQYNDAANLIEENDTRIKHLEETVTTTRLDIKTLKSKMEELHYELRFKEDEHKQLRTSKEMLEKEKTKLAEHEKQSLTFLHELLASVNDAKSKLSEGKMQYNSMLKNTTIKHLEETVSAYRWKMDKLYCKLRFKEDDLKQLRTSNEMNLDALEKQVGQLQTTLEEKEQLVLLYKDREQELEDKNAELLEALVDAEKSSQRNDQAINDIWREIRVEKLESVTTEKEEDGPAPMHSSALEDDGGGSRGLSVNDAEELQKPSMGRVSLREATKVPIY
ncbi:hypothetical protein Vadar_022132 [Vaccinium darrowii]|uniref:Uncharacterized protein n=1 Tax=Vaccinium darrowii TaxID=229202 RepID=A0ACB7XJK2_9ERIC|nr:hypothetical protein Vadar_022132 [Vaccinium darrowii]